MRFVTPQAIISTGSDVIGASKVGVVGTEEGKGRPATAEAGFNRPKRVFSAGGNLLLALSPAYELYYKLLSIIFTCTGSNLVTWTVLGQPETYPRVT